MDVGAGVPGADKFTGWVIGTLVTVITVLAGVIVKMYADAKAINRHRLAERDTLVRALDSVKQAQAESTAAAVERNALTTSMAKIISELAIQNEASSTVAKMQFDFIKDDHARLALVVASIAEGMRGLSMINTDMKTAVLALEPMLRELKDNLRRQQ